MGAENTIGLRMRSVYDLEGGMVTNRNFSQVQINEVQAVLNGYVNRDGAIDQRLGPTKLYSLPIGGNPTITQLLNLGRSTGGDLVLGCANTGVVYDVTSGAVPTVVTSGLTPLAQVMGVMLNDYMFCVDGVDAPFMTQGTSVTTYQVGITAVTAAQLAGMTFPAGPYPNGDATPGTHRITIRYLSSITGARSNPYIVGTTIQSQTFTVPADPNDSYVFDIGAAAVSVDPQVTAIQFFAQTAGAGVDAPYYFLGQTANAVGTATFSSGVDDDSLQLQETLDVDDDVAPSTLSDIESWRNRLVGIVSDYEVAFSKIRIDGSSIVDLPTSWPPTNRIPVGQGDGDVLVKVMRFFDYLIVFKQRSVWMIVGDFDSASLEARRLKTNYVNVGLLNNRCLAQAGNKCFFVSDDLKFHGFDVTNVSTEQLRLAEPYISDPIQNLFTTFASQYRDAVNVVNFSFSEYTQVHISFSNGSNGMAQSNNFNQFVFDYSAKQGRGAWTVNTGLEVASSCLYRDGLGNYTVLTGDYFGLVWKQNQMIGDGVAINGTSSGGNGLATFNDTTKTFTNASIGTFLSIRSGTGAGQVRRVTGVNAPTQLAIAPDWATIPDNTSQYSDGGTDFEVWSRQDWCDDSVPIESDKYLWYLDLDVDMISSFPSPFTYMVQMYRNRSQVQSGATRTVSNDLIASIWGSAIWGIDVWGGETVAYNALGFDLYFKQIQHRIINNLAGQRLRVNGWTYSFQTLDHVRR